MKIKGITKKVAPVLAMGGGAVGANFLAAKLPFADEKIQAGVLVLAGLVLSASTKGLVSDLSTGVAIGGVVKLASSFGIGALPDPIMELEDLDIYDSDGVNGIPDPIMGYAEFEE